MPAQYWLLKTEPETYSFARLQKEKKTNWNDVRNYQARNYLRQVKTGDLTVIYHSGEEKAVVGVAKCVRESYPDRDPGDDAEWVQIDIAPVQAMKSPVSLGIIKTTASLKAMPLIKQSRLSVMPITRAEYETLLKLGEKPSRP
jgi:predicted RNA-binding protein with PUA-like domain